MSYVVWKQSKYYSQTVLQLEKNDNTLRRDVPTFFYTTTFSKKIAYIPNLTVTLWFYLTIPSSLIPFHSLPSLSGRHPLS